MNQRKLFFNLIVLFTLPLLGLLGSMVGLAGLAQAAPVVMTERSGLALPPALPPTSTILSPNSVAENQITGTLVGTFSTSDPDPDTHTYTFTDMGSFPDNTFFSIVSDTLKTAVVFNFEATPSYTIRVLTTDSGNETLETTFIINVTNINEAPTDITLSNNSVAENAGVNAIVGTLSAVDPDAGSSFTVSPFCRSPWNPAGRSASAW